MQPDAVPSFGVLTLRGVFMGTLTREDLEILTELRRGDLRDFKDDLGDLLDSKISPLVEAIKRHDEHLVRHDEHLSDMNAQVAVNKTKVGGLTAVVSIIVSAAVTTLLKALRLG